MPHRKKSSSASGSVAAYLIAILLMTGSICAGRREVEVLPHVVVGSFSTEAGEFQFVTEIQIVLAQRAPYWSLSYPGSDPWSGHVLIMLPGVYDVHVVNVANVEGRRYPAQRGESRIPISIHQYAGTRVIRISSEDRLLSGSVVIDGPSTQIGSSELAISAGYRIVNADTGKLSDAVSVPVVAGGYERTRSRRVIIPVHLRPGQSLGVSYMLESRGSEVEDLSEVEYAIHASLYTHTHQHGTPPPQNSISSGHTVVDTVSLKSFYQHAGAWSLDQYFPNLIKVYKGATGMLELRVIGDYRYIYIRATAFVYEIGDDGALRYTTVEVKHLRGD